MVGESLLQADTEVRSKARNHTPATRATTPDLEESRRDRRGHYVRNSRGQARVHPIVMHEFGVNKSSQASARWLSIATRPSLLSWCAASECPMGQFQSMSAAFAYNLESSGEKRHRALLEHSSRTDSGAMGRAFAAMSIDAQRRKLAENSPMPTATIGRVETVGRRTAVDSKRSFMNVRDGHHNAPLQTGIRARISIPSPAPAGRPHTDA